ncbi:hypothetical protein GF386_01165 [Candidatus Pacearchaeota archaeon]|nr:hypothetical protein [Candidatus Pacearchaeota archaeon]
MKKRLLGFLAIGLMLVFSSLISADLCRGYDGYYSDCGYKYYCSSCHDDWEDYGEYTKEYGTKKHEGHVVHYPRHSKYSGRDYHYNPHYTREPLNYEEEYKVTLEHVRDDEFYHEETKRVMTDSVESSRRSKKPYYYAKHTVPYYDIHPYSYYSDSGYHDPYERHPDDYYSGLIYNVFYNHYRDYSSWRY